MTGAHAMHPAPLSRHGLTRPPWSCWLAALWLGCLGFGGLGAAEPMAAIRGLPFTRDYSFEEIGNILRGATLSFDPLGRIAAIQNGRYLVLNDETWLDLAAGTPGQARVVAATTDSAGNIYYGAMGSWGVLTATPDGRLQTRPFQAIDRPNWVLSTIFNDLLCTPEGVYFAGSQGVVFWNRRTNTHLFFEIPSVARIFSLADAVYVSTHARGVLELNGPRGTLAAPAQDSFGTIVIDNHAPFAGGGSLASTTNRQLLVIDEGRLIPLSGPLGAQLPGRITAMQPLAEGTIAVAVTGGGLYIVDQQGTLTLALTSPEYHRINALASNEPGVLWAATETGVVKILHGGPVTMFGHSLGLPVRWPQAVQWNGQTIVASAGRLYEALPSPPGTPTRFQLVADQPGSGAWGIATLGPWLLAGNQRVYAKRPGTEFQRILDLPASRLAVIEGGVCLVISDDVIAALRCENGIWTECAPRIPGLGYPFAVHVAAHSAWIELGVNRAARLSLQSGRLEARVFDSFPWPEPNWVHVNVLGDTVALIGADASRVFFDEVTQARVDAPAIREVLDRSPYPPSRIVRDERGTWWLSHAHGVLSLTAAHGSFNIDSASYDVIGEAVPMLQMLPGAGLLVAQDESLYHIDPSHANAALRRFHPVLVSVHDTRTHREIYRGGETGGAIRPLKHQENSLSFRFFSGSYQSRRPPGYEYRIDDAPWSSLGVSSLLNLSDQPEGDYRLDVRLVDARGTIGSVTSVAFSIEPPWYRTRTAWTAYALLSVCFIVAIVRISLHRTRARNAELETMVAHRTEQLQAAMQKLQQETHIAATLSERNRLAGEIHDSLEQGFSGLLLQLETIAGFATCPPELRAGLAGAQNMVTFSRNEVRHAVWNLHSPLLDAGGLEAALQHIVSQLTPEPTHATVTVTGPSRPLGSAVEHHLLRIAQEAIANAVKHAAAHHIDIRLTFSDDAVSLSVRDDGRGFDSNYFLAGPTGHFGLRSLRGRADKIRGHLAVTSQPGAGTCVSVRVPLIPDKVV